PREERSKCLDLSSFYIAETVKKGLSTRTHKCPHCGTVLQRDVNAAINILCKAKSTAGQAGSNAWGDVSSTSIGRKTCKGKKRQ
ncbi:zinc ribbon domain-containing protein, partial [Scytonema sp. PCC 10023]|uniref:zinc ribbon domain-containing protein n=1 Tax=Scytonema sp. PCC 10023 TaxID=1680591 RepID=UPI0039C608CF